METGVSEESQDIASLETWLDFLRLEPVKVVGAYRRTDLVGEEDLYDDNDNNHPPPNLFAEDPLTGKRKAEGKKPEAPEKQNRPPTPQTERLQTSGPSDAMDEASVTNRRFINAAKCGKEGLVRRLLKEGAEVNSIDKAGGTALIRAAANGYVDIVKILLEHGADTTAKTPSGLTAMDKAVTKEWPSVVKVLKQALPGRNSDAWRSYRPNPANTSYSVGGPLVFGRDWSSSLSIGSASGSTSTSGAAFGGAIVTSHLPQEYLNTVAAGRIRDGMSAGAREAPRKPSMNVTFYSAVGDKGSVAWANRQRRG